MTMLLRLILLFAIAVFGVSAVCAQSVPSGTFTPGHTVRCQNSTCTVFTDAGGSAGSNKIGQNYLTEIGITNTGTPFCINDALTNASGGYHQMCLGANSLGGGLFSYNAYGGATPLPLQCNINGVSGACLQSGFPYVITNVLLAGTATATYPAGVLRTGFYAQGDSPSLLFFPETGTCLANGRVNDGGSCVNTTAGDNNSWYSVFPASGGSVKQFGAKCNGSSSSAENTAIQAAVTALSQVSFPADCEFSATIALHSNLTINGPYSGRLAPFVLYCRTGASDCFSATGLNNVLIQNFNIDATGNTGGAIFDIATTEDITFNNVYMANVYNGMLFTTGNNMTLNNIQIDYVNGSYGLKWDSPSVEGDVLTIQNSIIACVFNATPANTADGLVWDGNTKTLNLQNFYALQCNHGVKVVNSRGQASFPQFLFANNMQLEGAVSDAFYASSGSSFWITNSYIKNQRSSAQGQSDGPDFYLLCDTVASAACGGAGDGASATLMLSNTQIFDSSSECMAIDWQHVTISNVISNTCSEASIHTNPIFLVGAHVAAFVISGNDLRDVNSNYAIKTTMGCQGVVTVKSNDLYGNTGPMDDVGGCTDGINRDVQVFLQTSSSTTVSGTVPVLATVETVTCTQSGAALGGAFFTSVSGTTLTITQVNSATQAYNCIAGGF